MKHTRAHDTHSLSLLLKAITVSLEKNYIRKYREEVLKM